jgi:hypothetical protein
MHSIAAFAAALLAAAPVLTRAAGATKVEAAIWAHGELYDTVLTPTSFKAPPSHSVDLIYDFAMSGLQGQRSVSESAPGDPTYNGGRWSVQMVVFTAQGAAVHDPDGDGVVNFELMSAEEVLQQAALGHLEIFDSGVSFECPLLPRH